MKLACFSSTPRCKENCTLCVCVRVDVCARACLSIYVSLYFENPSRVLMIVFEPFAPVF